MLNFGRITIIYGAVPEWPNGKVCKTFVRGFESRPRLMKVVVIGAGFTGLAAASDLARAGHQVTVFEANENPGGLAAGFENTGWDWSLEQHYHHIFSSDKDIITWFQELGLIDLLFFSRVKTATYYQDKIFQLDSPLSLLKCPVLLLPAKMRTAITLVFLKLWPWWQALEGQTAKEFLIKTMGQEAWRVLWEPLFISKFGKFASKVNASWFWARIKARTPKLGYFKGGFGRLAKAAVGKLETLGVTFHFASPVTQITHVDQHWQVKFHSSVKTLAEAKNWFAKSANKSSDSQLTKVFDRVIFTGDAQLLTKLVPSLPADYKQKIGQLESLAVRTLILELDKPFFKDQTYWLSISQADWPFLAVVEHTKLAGRQNYGGKTFVYVGKYLETTDRLYQMSQAELLKLYTPFLSRLSPGFEENIVNVWDYKSRFAQPIAKLDHSRYVPALTTPLPGLYWASIQHVYPWDRGTNFAVKIGRQVANLIENNH